MDLEAIEQTTSKEFRSKEEQVKFEFELYTEWMESTDGLTAEQAVDLFFDRGNEIIEQIGAIYKDSHHAWLEVVAEMRSQGVKLNPNEPNKEVVDAIIEHISEYIIETQRVIEQKTCQILFGDFMDGGTIPPIKFLHIALTLAKGAEWTNTLFEETLGKVAEFNRANSEHLTQVLVDETFDLLSGDFSEAKNKIQ